MNKNLIITSLLILRPGPSEKCELTSFDIAVQEVIDERLLHDLARYTNSAHAGPYGSICPYPELVGRIHEFGLVVTIPCRHK